MYSVQAAPRSYGHSVHIAFTTPPHMDTQCVVAYTTWKAEKATSHLQHAKIEPRGSHCRTAASALQVPSQAYWVLTSPLLVKQPYTMLQQLSSLLRRGVSTTPLTVKISREFRTNTDMT